MAYTTVSSGNNLQNRVLDAKVVRDIMAGVTFTGSFSPAPESFVQLSNPTIDDRLMKKFAPGEASGAYNRFFVRLAPTKAPIKNGAQDIKGFAESQSYSAFNHELDMYEYPVNLHGDPLSVIRSIVDLDAEGRKMLSEAVAAHFDQLHFDALNSTPTQIAYWDSSTQKIIVTATAATATSGASTSQFLTPKIVLKCQELMETGNFAGSAKFFRAKKVKVGNEMVYLMIVRPECMTQFQTDATWTQFIREAKARSNDNVLFSRTAALVDKTLVISSEKVGIDTTSSGYSSTTVGLQHVRILGEQSMVQSVGKLKGESVAVYNFDENVHRSENLLARYYTKVSIPQFTHSSGSTVDYGSMGLYIPCEL